MKDHFACDRVLKDLFQTDQSMLIEYLTGGVRVAEFLNVEFQQVMERRADLVALLEDGSIFHFEFQGQNDGDIACRMGVYGLLIWQRHHRPTRQVVLYVGNAGMRMPSQLDTGNIQVVLSLIDIRQVDAEMLLRSSSPGDLALAMLANGGTDYLSEIARRASQLGGKARARVLTQLILLSGLRGVSGRLRMEMKHMGSLQIDIRDNEILREVWEEVMAEGTAQGKAEGKAEGEQSAMRKALSWQLNSKYGQLPPWAEQRILGADVSQLELWFQRALTSESLAAALGD